MYQQYRTSRPSRSIKFDDSGNPIKGDNGYEFTSKYDHNFDLNSPEYQRKMETISNSFYFNEFRCLANPESIERKIVDLLWFPTGGGKTDLFRVICFSTRFRRIRDKSDYGTDVIMRYTLRLNSTAIP